MEGGRDGGREWKEESERGQKGRKGWGRERRMIRNLYYIAYYNKNRLPYCSHTVTHTHPLQHRLSLFPSHIHPHTLSPFTHISTHTDTLLASLTGDRYEALSAVHEKNSQAALTSSTAWRGREREKPPHLSSFLLHSFRSLCLGF